MGSGGLGTLPLLISLPLTISMPGSPSLLVLVYTSDGRGLRTCIPFSSGENRLIDIEAWKRRLEGGVPQEWCPGVAGPGHFN